MKSDNDHIKKIFSSKLSDFEPELPDSVWKRIDVDLSLIPINKKKARRHILYQTSAWVAGVAAVVLFLLWIIPKQNEAGVGKEVLVAQYFDSDKLKDRKIGDIDRESKLSNIVIKTDIPSNETVLAQANTTATNNIIDVISLNNRLKEEVENAKLLSDQLNGVIVATVTSPSILDSDPEEILGTISDIDDSDFNDKLNKQIAEFESEGKKLDELLAVNTVDKARPDKGNGFLLGVEGGSGFAKSNEDKNRINSIYPSNSDVIVLRKSKVKMEHNQPITFGIAINKRINDKISIESGITYTYLSSRVKSEANAEIKQKENQYFHYLGIPLTVNYTFAEWKRFRFYTSFGGMIQKDFYGRIRSHVSIDGLLETDVEERKKISQKNPQFSIMGTLGASYPIYNKLRAYTTFGGAYYFDAKNEHETIYSDKRWLFNLNLGLKFEF